MFELNAPNIEIERAIAESGGPRTSNCSTAYFDAAPVTSVATGSAGGRFASSARSRTPRGTKSRAGMGSGVRHLARRLVLNHSPRGSARAR